LALFVGFLVVVQKNDCLIFLLFIMGEMRREGGTNDKGGFPVMERRKEG